MMRLAEAGAVAIGPERGGYHMYWTYVRARHRGDNRNRHLLDVSAAHLELRHYDEAFGVLYELSQDAGPWLAEQRMAQGSSAGSLRGAGR